MLANILLWGSVAGLVHFMLIGLLYGNPIIDRMYAQAVDHSPAVRRWSSKPRYLVTQFLGTQIEVFILTAAFLWLRSYASSSVLAALAIGAMLAAIRVYPRFWNMWIQTTYPRRLLAVEAINGTIGTVAIALFLQVGMTA